MKNIVCKNISNNNGCNGSDELADLALHSESDSVRDECSSGVRSEAEEAEQDRRQQRCKGEVSIGH